MFGYHDNDRCAFDLWSPVEEKRVCTNTDRSYFSELYDRPNHCAIENRAFNSYAGSFELAARELARTPEAQYDETLQAEICAKYGVFLDNITDDEARHLEMLIEEIAII